MFAPRAREDLLEAREITPRRAEGALSTGGSTQVHGGQGLMRATVSATAATTIILLFNNICSSMVL